MQKIDKSNINIISNNNQPIKNETSFIHCRNLTKKWENCNVDFSCDIPQGTMLALVGKSGSGKSTILQMIAGIVPPDNNNNSSVIINQKECISLACSKRQIGFVFQNSTLFSHMKIVDNVAYGLRCKGMKKKLANVLAKEFLKKVELDGFAERMPDTLSGGEAQRVALARTLILKPAVVLFDEPFSALDKPLRKMLANDIKKAQDEYHFTGILVTHDIEDVKNLCQKVMVINKGKTVWYGNISEYSDDLL